MNRSNLSILTMIQVLLLCCSAAVMAQQQIRPLDWSKLDRGVEDDELGVMCKTVLEHTQKGMGKDWLDK